MRQTLDGFLASQQDQGAITADLAKVLTQLASACSSISKIVAMGALGGGFGSTGRQNVQDEDQQKLDLLTNNLLLQTLADGSVVAGAASEELETINSFAAAGHAGRYLVLFDPLDGSSNIEVNVSVGTIFSILPAPAAGQALTEADFLQSGANQVAAGYAIYGPQSMLVLTVKTGVVGFTLNPDDGAWLRTHDAITVPPDTREFAINMSNMRHWAPPVRRYIDSCLAGTTGDRGKDFNMRWIASMVADVHRVLMRGGVFLYPWDAREPTRPGKLRLMYEANPMSLLVEQAGGKATDGRQRILDITPGNLHERVGVVLGSANEVDEVVAHHERHNG